MNGGVILLLTGLFSVIFLLIQRTEAKRRRIALVLMIFVSLLTLYWANVRALGRELFIGFVIALVLNFLFWMLIGRYNPVGDSDKSIQVLGMDD